MTRRFSILSRLGVWGVTFGALASPLACAADVDLGTRGGAGEGSAAGSSSGNDDGGGTGGKVGSGGSPTNGSRGGTGGIPEDTCATELSATTKHDYSFSSELSLNVTKVKPNTNLTYDWSGLTTDLVGNPVELDSIVIDVALWAMSADEFATRWPQSNATTWIQDAEEDLVLLGNRYPDGETHATLLDLTWPSPPFSDDVLSYFDPVAYPPENHVYTITARTGGGSGIGTRMLGAFVLDEDSEETEVHLDSSSSRLTYDVDLRSLVPHAVPFGVPGLTIDWANLEQTGIGQPFDDPHQVTRVEVASYALTPFDLEGAAFMRRDTIADGRWSATLFDTDSFDLSRTVDADHQPFPGIDAAHVWLVSLGCDFCDAIAPLYLSVLHTCNTCGDGVVQADFGETCDDGINSGDYGGCMPDCQLGPHCGDGLIQTAFGEECDTGDRNGDGICTTACKVEKDL
jgi:cysteine-rich repeat protein